MSFTFYGFNVFGTENGLVCYRSNTEMFDDMQSKDTVEMLRG